MILSFMPSRRDFIRLMGGAGLLLATNQFGKLPNRDLPHIEEKGFHVLIDSYEASSWVAANMAVAATRLDGQIIDQHGDFSMIKALGLDTDPLDSTNTDPSNGYVMGYVNSKLDKEVGAGVCKTTTDLFRCALRSPMLIDEAHSHTEIISTYFKNFPIGTDAAVFVDDKNIVDLKLKNPFPFPVQINYHLHDTNGKLINPKEFLRPLMPLDYAVNLVTYGFRYLRSNGISVPKGYIQDDMGIVNLVTTCSFEPVSVAKVNIPQWNVELAEPQLQPDGAYRLSRTVTIGGVARNETFTTLYKS